MTSEIDHRAIFLEMVQGRVRARAISAAFARGSGFLMHRDHSRRAFAKLEEEVKFYLDYVKDIPFGRSDRTPDSHALASAERSTGAWWIVTFTKRHPATEMRDGDIFLSAQQVADVMDFDAFLDDIYGGAAGADQ